ncbi:MAG: hypothetical protein Q7J73_10795 [Dehalococcoidales bacterium]|nr:hypothetical protein [Dehalococcoidales bacterium]
MKDEKILPFESEADDAQAELPEAHVFNAMPSALPTMTLEQARAKFPQLTEEQHRSIVKDAVDAYQISPEDVPYEDIKRDALTKKRSERNVQFSKFALHKSLGDILPNLIFFGIGVPIVMLLGRWHHWLGIIGFGVYAITLLFDSLRMVVLFVTSIILFFSPAEAGHVPKAQAISWITTLIQLFETAIFAIYVGILYRFFFL